MMEPIVVEVGPSDAAVRIGDLWVYEWDESASDPEPPKSYSVPLQLKLIKRDEKMYADGWAHIEVSTFWKYYDDAGATHILLLDHFVPDTREVEIVVIGTTRVPFSFRGDTAWIQMKQSQTKLSNLARSAVVGVISHVIPEYSNDVACTIKRHRVFVTMQGAAKARVYFGPSKENISGLKKARADHAGVFMIHMREQIVRAHDDGEQLRDVHISRHHRRL